MKNKNRLYYRLKLFKNGKTIKDTRTSKKMRILNFAQVENWQSAYIKVTYKPQYYNDGIYNNIKNLKMAMSQFTEKDLVNKFCRKEN